MNEARAKEMPAAGEDQTTMSTQDPLGQLKLVTAGYRKQRARRGKQVPGILRVPRSMLSALAGCSRQDWQGHGWAILASDLEALGGSEPVAIATLKQVLLLNGIPLAEAEVIDGEHLEIVTVPKE
jgi:hypothetical protein